MNITDTASSFLIESAVKAILEKLKNRTSSVSYLGMPEERLWSELVACLLGSGVLFETAQSTCSVLQTRGLLEIPEKKSYYDAWEEEIKNVLNSPLFLPLKRDGTGRRYRYPIVKARQIRITAESIYGEGHSLKRFLDESDSENEARSLVSDRSCGIGIKQASLFLRNIGFAMDLAILDTHVLRYMLDFGMIAKKSIQNFNAKIYFHVEEELRSYAEKLGSQLAYVDTAIWIVMRVARREKEDGFGFAGVGRH